MLEDTAIEEAQAQLLRRIAARDRDALAELYDQTAGVLFSNAVRILGNAHEAEEVIQDVFVQIWNKAASFDPELGAPFDWTMSITRNRCIDRIRSQRRQSRFLEDLTEAALAEAGTATGCARELLTEDEFAAVRAAVMSLPPEQRKVIEMAFFRGMTHHEITEALVEPLGTVKARIRRGMLKLRENLQAYVC